MGGGKCRTSYMRVLRRQGQPAGRRGASAQPITRRCAALLCVVSPIHCSSFDAQTSDGVRALVDRLPTVCAPPSRRTPAEHVTHARRRRLRQSPGRQIERRRRRSWPALRRTWRGPCRRPRSSPRSRCRSRSPVPRRRRAAPPLPPPPRRRRRPRSASRRRSAAEAVAAGRTRAG